MEDKGDEADGGWAGVIIASGETSGLGIRGFALLKPKFCFTPGSAAWLRPCHLSTRGILTGLLLPQTVFRGVSPDSNSVAYRLEGS